MNLIQLFLDGIDPNEGWGLEGIEDSTMLPSTVPFWDPKSRETRGQRAKSYRSADPAGLGVLRSLPLELREMIYHHLLPGKYGNKKLKLDDSWTEDDLIRKGFDDVKHDEDNNGVPALLRVSRGMYSELQPAWETWAKPRRYELSVGANGVRFEGVEHLQDPRLRHPVELHAMRNAVLNQGLAKLGRLMPGIRKLCITIDIDQTMLPVEKQQLLAHLWRAVHMAPGCSVRDIRFIFRRVDPLTHPDPLLVRLSRIAGRPVGKFGSKAPTLPERLTPRLALRPEQARQCVHDPSVMAKLMSRISEKKDKPVDDA